MVRAKFTVTEVHSFHYGTSKKHILTPVYDSSIPEDRRFAQATPSGRIEMYVDNPPASDELAIGKTFYVDFTEAPTA